MAAALYLRDWVDDYRTVYNPIEYVLEETDATTLNYDGFKYVIGIYNTAGSTLLAKLKVPIDVNNYGRCDVHGVCENYLTTDLGVIDTDITTPTGAAFTNNANSYYTFVIKFGEEYDSGSGMTETFPMTYDKDGSPTTSETLITFNGSLPNYRGTVVNFYDWQAANYYQNYTVNALTRNWLTNQPNIAINSADNLNVELTDSGWLYFLYDHASNPSDEMIVTTYNSSGGTVATFVIDNTVLAAANKSAKVPSSPQSLNDILPALVTSGSQPIIPTTGVTSYSLYLSNSSTRVSDYMYFTLSSECRYEVRRLEFLNSLGGFDCFNFTKVSKRTEDIERKFFKMNQDNLNSSTGIIDYDIADREKVQYYTVSRPKMKVTSDWLSVSKFNWLLELISSPEIYLHENNKRIPIKNVVGEWEEKRSTVDSIFNLELTLDFGMDNTRQRW